MSQIDIDGAGGVTDHGALTGLSDDDHTQYALQNGRQGSDLIIRGITGLIDIRKLSLIFNYGAGDVEEAFFYYDPDTGITILGSTTDNLIIKVGTKEWDFTSNGHLIPGASALFNIGSVASAISNLYAKRLHTTAGTTLVAGDFTLSAGWGTTATVVTVSGNDQRFRFTVNATGTGQSANPTVTFLFKDGNWPVAPFAVCSRNDFNAPTARAIWTTTVSQLVITLPSTPVAGSAYSYECILLG